MTEQKTNGISLIASDSRAHIAINADLTFNVEKQNDVEAVHIADVLYTLVLEAIKQQAANAQLTPGEYRLVLTGMVSDVTPTIEQRKAQLKKELEDLEFLERTADAEAEAGGVITAGNLVPEEETEEAETDEVSESEDI